MEVQGLSKIVLETKSSEPANFFHCQNVDIAITCQYLFKPMKQLKLPKLYILYIYCDVIVAL